MIQTGDPDSKNAEPGSKLGSGGPGYTIPSEITPKFVHEKGALSAARLGDNINPKKESSGSQFYVVQGRKYNSSELKEMIDNANYGLLMNKLNQIFGQGKHRELLNELITLQQEGDLKKLKGRVLECRSIIEQETGPIKFKSTTTRQIDVYAQNGGAPHLDGDYTVFGRVVEGIDIIDKIAAQQTDQQDRPVEDIHMSIEVETVAKNQITRDYGYVYPEN